MAHAHVHNVEPIEGSFVPRPAAGLISLELDGELLLVDPRTDGVHQLDRLGAVVWSVLDGEATVNELVEDFADAFDVPVDAMRLDLGDMLTALRNIGALEVEASPPNIMAEGGDAQQTPGDDGLWRPSYLVDPPAP